MEPITTIGAGLAVLGSKDILTKLLGPSADYIGLETKNLIDKCNINLDDIFKLAINKLGENIEKRHQVNPRVLKGIINEGAFCDDMMVKEYYAGILASSRSERGIDDRGVYYLSIVKSLSAYQIKLHNFIYTTLYQSLNGSNKFEFGDYSDRKHLDLFISISAICNYLHIEDLSNEEIMPIFAHAVDGLQQNRLINSDYIYGPNARLKKLCKALSSKEDGLILQPDLPGADLFLWSIGACEKSGPEFLDLGLSLTEKILMEEDDWEVFFKKVKIKT